MRFSQRWTESIASSKSIDPSEESATIAVLPLLATRLCLISNRQSGTPAFRFSQTEQTPLMTASVTAH